MDTEFSISEAWPKIKQVNWLETDFSLDKSFVCVLFSELAYLRIADFELQDAKRVNVIPCFAHQEAVKSGDVIDFDAVLKSSDFGDYFAVIRRYAVVIGVRTPNVIFVSIRGTRYLYDWAVNMNAQKYCISQGEHAACFHRGFFRAISACLEPVSVHLREFLKANNVPIYVTGHSLGGALAAIMHALWGMTLSAEYVQEGVAEIRVRTHSSFTFGMPRYGNIDAIATHRGPYHIYNEKDIVPTVPPRWLGFESCFSEYRTDGVGIETTPNRESLGFAAWLYRLALGRGVADHAVELYRTRIAECVKGN